MFAIHKQVLRWALKGYLSLLNVARVFPLYLTRGFILNSYVIYVGKSNREKRGIEFRVIVVVTWNVRMFDVNEYLLTSARSN